MQRSKFRINLTLTYNPDIEMTCQINQCLRLYMSCSLQSEWFQRIFDVRVMISSYLRYHRQLACDTSLFVIRLTNVIFHQLHALAC
jgi:hypothetical protein